MMRMRNEDRDHRDNHIHHDQDDHGHPDHYITLSLTIPESGWMSNQGCYHDEENDCDNHNEHDQNYHHHHHGVTLSLGVPESGWLSIQGC